MVSPKSETARRTGWGDSTYFGRVITPSSQADVITKNGVVHLMVPIAVENLSIAESIVKVQSTYAAAHDLKPLP